MSRFHENPKPVILSIPTSYGYRSVLEELNIKLNESMTRQKEVLNLLPLFLKKDMFIQFQMIQWLEMLKVTAPCHGNMGQRQCVSLPQVLHDIV